MGTLTAHVIYAWRTGSAHRMYSNWRMYHVGIRSYCYHIRQWSRMHLLLKKTLTVWQTFPCPVYSQARRLVSRHVHHRLVWKSLIITESTAQAKRDVYKRQVIFRHEKPFVSKPRYAVALCTCMDYATVEAKLAEIPKVDYDRIGERMYAELVYVNCGEGADAAKYTALVEKAAGLGRTLVLECKDPEIAKAALAVCKDSKPVLNLSLIHIYVFTCNFNNICNAVLAAKFHVVYFRTNNCNLMVFYLSLIHIFPPDILRQKYVMSFCFPVLRSLTGHDIFRRLRFRNMVHQ